MNLFFLSRHFRHKRFFCKSWTSACQKKSSIDYLFTTQYQLLTTMTKEPFENIGRKGENVVNQYFPFQMMFCTLLKSTSIILA